ncbi:MAG: glycoside hydrolase family 31 protein [Saccharolobus sp.]|uniref:glycoside hydrolase family 31 protein n=1 Tax=Saccharolobus sp. TaxID=2100761 RepID=UPI0028CBECB9|nr:glycoside hydrolase family 31 protein [Saccharolobus sp.]MDT7862610.1 glycoside hydrolase family 31 protein [Saccharolobus sp.]
MRLGDLNIDVKFYLENAIRITYYYHSLNNYKSLIIVGQPNNIEIRKKDENGFIQISSNRLQLVITPEAELIIKDNRGNVLIKEIYRNLIFSEKLQTYNLEHIFELAENENIYGLGQHAGGNGLGQSSVFKIGYRGSTITLSQRNTDIAIPFLVSSKGYGILWDNYSLGSISLKGNKMKIWFEAGNSLDYYFIYGESLDEVIGTYRKLTGEAPLLPKWAYGYWQSKERYKSQDELVNVVKEFRNRKIPLDVIVLDWRYWGKYGWNAFKFDEEDFPDPKGMIEEIHRLKAKLMISIWPTFGKETDVYKEMEANGCIISGTTCFNPFKEECRELFWKHVKKFLDLGVDGWWLDASEPETGFGLVFFSPIHDADLGIGKGYIYLNVFPLMETKAVYEGQRKSSNNRVVILTRSAFAGQQRYSAISWSGDILGDWDTLRAQIPAGLNFSISGIPYWTTDIGGFFSGNPESESYREIFIRWLQWGVFCSIFRVHGTIFPKEPWRFGKDGENVIVKFIRLRYRLLPYIYSLAWMVYSKGYTIMRPLVMDFKDDYNVYDIDDQYMFGPYILVSPITLPSIKERELYLPKEKWYDFWNGDIIQGGRWIRAKVSIDMIPIHIKAGAILPLADFIENSGDEYSSIELRVYTGNSGKFEIYDDDGMTYDYEKGKYSIIPIEWNEEKQELIIGNKKGELNVKKEIRIVWVNRNNGIGIELSKPDQIVTYNGSEIRIKR